MLPAWLKQKLTGCRNRGGCPPWRAYPDNLPEEPAPVDLVPDSGFDDPGAWYTNPPGIEVAGSRYVFTGALLTGNRILDAAIDAQYEYVVEVASVDPASSGGIYIGGSLNRVWRPVDGAGTFTGTVTATELWLLDIVAGSFAFPPTTGTFSLDRVSIYLKY